MSSIQLTGVTTHNLKNINVSFPIGELTVVHGVSGSGKTSLVFDSLYGESYRRFVESLSSYARQYIKTLPKPEINAVENLPPAIAVRQSRSGSSTRSTVGTMTEMNDILRILFSKLAEMHCTECGTKLRKDSQVVILNELIENFLDQQVSICAPLNLWKDVAAKGLKEQLIAQGFKRVMLGDETLKLTDLALSDIYKASVIVDRLTVDKDEKDRLLEGISTGMKLGKQHLNIQVSSKKGLLEKSYIGFFGCASCDRAFSEPTMSLFSFNHPQGACNVCQGFGKEQAIDWGKVIPDKDACLADKAVAPWNFGQHTRMYSVARESAQKLAIDIKKPFGKYHKKEWEWLQTGKWPDEKKTKFTGVLGYFDWLASKRHKMHYRIHAARFRKYVTCSSCQGKRLNAYALGAKLADHSFAEVSSMRMPQLLKWSQEVDQLTKQLLETHDSLGFGAGEALLELHARVDYLIRVGLSYLHGDRLTNTLSGGELQRIHMSRCLGSGLTETLYCLDEPTVGLHPRDSQKLLGVLKELRDNGNTVVVVEHEKQIIKAADHLVEIGPEAGHLGGEVVFAGKPKAQKKTEFKFPHYEKTQPKNFLEIKKVSTHNLKNISAKFPVGKFSVVCGVSGSGKTSLIQHSLYPSLCKYYGQDLAGYVSEQADLGTLGPKTSLEYHEAVVHVDQAPLGRSTRSNVLTYLKVYDEIRKIFAATPKAKQLKLKPGHFSFNTKGGRCETCRGLGVVEEDLSFLGAMDVICPDCGGKRFSDSVLSVKYRDKSITDLLEMTTLQARELFLDSKKITTVLDEVLDLGLGYMCLGQHTSSFSGGEAQRLKLLRILKDQTKLKPAVLIFDEPTTGLSDSDVARLIAQLRQLCQRGHTVIVIEHHVEMMRAADWLIEIGPEAADLGGELVFQGLPNELASVDLSPTAKFM